MHRNASPRASYELRLGDHFRALMRGIAHQLGVTMRATPTEKWVYFPTREGFFHGGQRIERSVAEDIAAYLARRLSPTAAK